MAKCEQIGRGNVLTAARLLRYRSVTGSFYNLYPLNTRCMMTNLTRASDELFRRPADERFETLDELHHHCQQAKQQSRRLKEPADEFCPVVDDGRLMLRINGHQPHRLNDWSFGQLVGLAGVAKETVNRLQSTTAAQVLTETLHQRLDGETELQALVHDAALIRAINGERYKPLWNADLLSMTREFATDFTPPQKGMNGGTGLYAGQQDLFVFLIDPNGWVEINGEAFAPGFYCWNSEVGARTVGVSTFWFQSVCANHVIWDATDVTEVVRRHTGKASKSLAAIRDVIEALVAKRDQRKDGFAKVIAKAMETTYGTDIEDVQKLLAKAGFTRALAKKAAELAQQSGRFTIWSVVDALTQLSRDAKFAGSRTDADQKASSLLALAAA